MAGSRRSLNWRPAVRRVVAPLRRLTRQLPGGDRRHERRLTERLGDPAAITAREATMVAMIRAAEPDRSVIRPASVDWAWPAAGPVRSGFGVRVGRMHFGIDIAAPDGQPVTAAAAGLVRLCLDLADYGKTTVISHAPGVMTLYGHQRDVAVVPGQTVRGGETIGHVGTTGRSTGPHLHFEVRTDGVARDPLEVLPAIAAEPQPGRPAGTESPSTEGPASAAASNGQE